MITVTMTSIFIILWAAAQTVGLAENDLLPNA